jgi:hypothetical protein
MGRLKTEICWYVDGTPFAVRNEKSSVGGNYSGSPRGATVFPVTMEVEYVRVCSGEP